MQSDEESIGRSHAAVLRSVKFATVLVGAGTLALALLLVLSATGAFGVAPVAVELWDALVGLLFILIGALVLLVYRWFVAAEIRGEPLEPVDPWEQPPPGHERPGGDSDES